MVGAVLLRVVRDVVNMREHITNHNIAWEVTDSCNHNCFYCYNHFKTNEISNEDVNDYDKIAEKILSFQPVSVAITGGEPLLVFDKVKKSIETFIQQNIFVRLLTNGTLITEEIAHFLKKSNIQVMVSVPANDSDIFYKITGMNSYDNVVAGLDLLHKYGVDFLINIVVQSMNLQYMESTADFLIHRYSLESIYFSRATKPIGVDNSIENQLLDNEQLNTFFDKCVDIRKRYDISVRTCGGYAYCSIDNKDAISIFAKGCGIEGEQSFVINSKGDVRFCGKDNRTYGNIFEENISSIRQRMKMQNDFALPHECKRCKWRKLCKGGCHMSSYTDKPAFNNIDANANPKNTKLEVIKRNYYILPLFKQYVLNDNVVKKVINKKIRYSYTFFPCIVPKRVSEFLDVNKSINLLTILVLSALSFKNGYTLMKELIRCQIIKSKK